MIGNHECLDQEQEPCCGSCANAIPAIMCRIDGVYLDPDDRGRMTNCIYSPVEKSLEARYRQLELLASQMLELIHSSQFAGVGITTEIYKDFRGKLKGLWVSLDEQD